MWSMLGEAIGKILSTPTPSLTLRTVIVAPASEPCLAARMEIAHDATQNEPADEPNRFMDV